MLKYSLRVVLLFKLSAKQTFQQVTDGWCWNSKRLHYLSEVSSAAECLETLAV